MEFNTTRNHCEAKPNIGTYFNKAHPSRKLLYWPWASPWVKTIVAWECGSNKTSKLYNLGKACGEGRWGFQLKKWKKVFIL
jgi:hypothetical protein